MRCQPGMRWIHEVRIVHALDRRREVPAAVEQREERRRGVELAHRLEALLPAAHAGEPVVDDRDARASRRQDLPVERERAPRRVVPGEEPGALEAEVHEPLAQRGVVEDAADRLDERVGALGREVARRRARAPRGATRSTRRPPACRRPSPPAAAGRSPRSARGRRRPPPPRRAGRAPRGPPARRSGAPVDAELGGCAGRAPGAARSSPPTSSSRSAG